MCVQVRAPPCPLPNSHSYTWSAWRAITVHKKSSDPQSRVYANIIHSNDISNMSCIYTLILTLQARMESDMYAINILHRLHVLRSNMICIHNHKIMYIHTCTNKHIHAHAHAWRKIWNLLGHAASYITHSYVRDDFFVCDLLRAICTSQTCEATWSIHVCVTGLICTWPFHSAHMCEIT